MVADGRLVPVAPTGHNSAVAVDRNPLAGVGVDSGDETVLRALLRHPQATAEELTASSGQPAERVASSLARLQARGLAARLAGPDQRFAAADPRVALDSLIQPVEQALRRARDASGELAALFHAVRDQGQVDAPVEVVAGSEEVSRAFVRMQQNVLHSVRAFDRPPYVNAAGNPVEPAILERGVRWRAIYHPAAFEVPGSYREVRHLVSLGEQARVLAEVPFKMHLVDDRVALVPLEPRAETVRAALVHPSPLLDALVLLFESCWERAVPLDARPGEEAISDEDRQLLALLAAGVKDDAIGRALGLSVRTMRRRVRRLLESLGAQTRFQAGMQATRRGWI